MNTVDIVVLFGPTMWKFGDAMGLWTRHFVRTWCRYSTVYETIAPLRNGRCKETFRATGRGQPLSRVGRCDTPSKHPGEAESDDDHDDISQISANARHIAQMRSRATPRMYKTHLCNQL